MGFHHHSCTLGHHDAHGSKSQFYILRYPNCQAHQENLMHKIKCKPNLFFGILYAKFSYGDDSIMNKDQGQPVNNDLLEALEEEKEFLVINPLALFLVVVQDEGKSQDDEAGNDHIIESFEILNLEH